MTEHLDTDLFTRGTTDMFFLHLTVDLCHLIHIQLTRQYNYIGELGIKLQGFDVRDVQLGREVHLLPHLITIGHHCHIRGDDCRDTCLLGGVDDLMHQGNILTVDDRVHRQITLDTMRITRLSHLLQIVDGEGRGRMRPHIQLLYTEVDAVSTSLDSRCQRFRRAHRGHDLICFDVFFHYGCKFTKKSSYLCTR